MNEKCDHSIQLTDEHGRMCGAWRLAVGGERCAGTARDSTGTDGQTSNARGKQKRTLGAAESCGTGGESRMEIGLVSGKDGQTLGRTMMSRPPVHEIRLGLIKASIWRNQTKAGERFNVTLCRLYKNGEVWKESGHFGRDDLLLTAKVLDLAHSWIMHPSQDEG